jgi:hypothetical protein
VKAQIHLRIYIYIYTYIYIYFSTGHNSLSLSLSCTLFALETTAHLAWGSSSSAFAERMESRRLRTSRTRTHRVTLKPSMRMSAGMKSDRHTRHACAISPQDTLLDIVCQVSRPMRCSECTVHTCCTRHDMITFQFANSVQGTHTVASVHVYAHARTLRLCANTLRT